MGQETGLAEGTSLPDALSRGEAPATWLDALLPLAIKLCLSREGEHGRRCVQQSHLECLKAPMNHLLLVRARRGSCQLLPL